MWLLGDALSTPLAVTEVFVLVGCIVVIVGADVIVIVEVYVDLDAVVVDDWLAKGSAVA